MKRNAKLVGTTAVLLRSALKFSGLFPNVASATVRPLPPGYTYRKPEPTDSVTALNSRNPARAFSIGGNVAIGERD